MKACAPKIQAKAEQFVQCLAAKRTVPGEAILGQSEPEPIPDQRDSKA